MKFVVCTSKNDAMSLQADDDAKAGCPLPGFYVDETRAPDGVGVTEHVSGIHESPDVDQWAYQISDDVDQETFTQQLSESSSVLMKNSKNTNVEEVSVSQFIIEEEIPWTQQFQDELETEMSNIKEVDSDVTLGDLKKV